MRHALRKALGVIAVVQGWGRPPGPPSWQHRPGAAVGASRLKAALDADRDDLAARDQALAKVLGFLDLVEAFIADPAGEQAAATAVAAARQIRD
jgi:hypothetical protein